MDLKIYVISHKSYRMPQDRIYIPLQVGFDEKSYDGYERDNTGDNISYLNPKMCELTAIYWVWKNRKCDYVGFTHYRRHFTDKSIAERLFKNKFDCIADGISIERRLAKSDVIVPKPRRYYVETMESHHKHLPHTFDKDYFILRDTIAEVTPEYLESFDKTMSRTWAHMFNMYVMKWEVFDKFCSWMFKILLECEKKIDTSNYSSMERRAVAYFGEFMIDVWMNKNGIKYSEMSVMYMEKQNWINKGFSFVSRKLGMKDFFYMNR